MTKSTLKTWALTAGLVGLVGLTGQSCTIGTSSAKADGGVFRSDDAGQSWKQKTLIGQVKKKTLTISNVDAGILQFHPTNPSTMYFGTLANGIYRTEDSGERWQVTGRQAGRVTAMAIDPKTPEILYAGNVGDIEKTIDGGLTWTKVYTESRPGIRVTSMLIDPRDPKHLFVGNSGGVILESRDYGQTWQTNHVFRRGIRSLASHPQNPSVIFAAHSKQGLSRSDDEGATWNSLDDSFKGLAGADQINGLAFSPDEAGLIYFATPYGLLRSPDLGTTIEAMETLVPKRALSIQTVLVSPSDSRRLYFTTRNKLHISNDAGSTWEVVTVPTKRLITRLAARPDQPSQLYVGTLLEKK